MAVRSCGTVDRY